MIVFQRIFTAYAENAEMNTGKKSFLCARCGDKWVVSDIPRGSAPGLASEYNKKYIPCIEIPCGLAGGSLQCFLVPARSG